MSIKVLAIRTDFSHHGEYSGYKQILKFTNPYEVIGNDERDPEYLKKSGLLKKYPWLFEFKGLRYRKDIDLIHILYGEDYFRWSAHLFRSIPVVATFHQPPEMLEREVLYGDLRGRIGKLTHAFAKSRFAKLSAAIVTNPTQAEVLRKVMPEDKIHYIPLGIYLNKLNDHYINFQKLKETKASASKGLIITVGAWLRDWNFYFKVVKKCSDLNFALVNKRFEPHEIAKLKEYPNLRFYDDISDDQLFNLFMQSDLQFLPVSAFAGSNAFLQGLALGCPIVLTDINAGEYKGKGDFILLYEKGDIDNAIKNINIMLSADAPEKKKLSEEARNFASEYSWETVAIKTMDLYKTLI